MDDTRHVDRSAPVGDRAEQLIAPRVDDERGLAEAAAQKYAGFYAAQEVADPEW
jgi:hypothetical protein